MKRAGFMIIEILIATFIASIINIILMAAFSQSMQFQKVVDDFFTISLHENILTRQLTHDITGAFIPLQAEPEITAQPVVTTPAQPSAQPPQTKTTQIDTASSSEKKSNPLEKVFYGTRKNNQFEMLTFITNNPMATYWSDSAGGAKPKRARIVYRLVPDDEHADSFILMRQEGTDLDFKKYTPKNSSIRAYKLISGIKNIEIEYSRGTPEKKDVPKNSDTPTLPANGTPFTSSNTQQNKNSKTPIYPHLIYKKETSWDSDKEREKNKETDKQKDKKEYNALLPYFVHIIAELWDAHYKRTNTIVCTIPIIVPDKKETTRTLPPKTSTPTPPAQPKVAPTATGELVQLQGNVQILPGFFPPLLVAKK